MGDLPAITGNELIQLLVKDGWKIMRHMNHGVGLAKYCHRRGRKIVTCVPSKNKPLSKQTLGAILSYDQTGIGWQGLREMINKYGL